MSFKNWSRHILEGSEPTWREALPAGKDSILSFWSFLRGDAVFFGICGLLVALIRWFWPVLSAGTQPEPLLPQQMISGLVSPQVLGVFLFAALIFVGLSSLIPRTLLLRSCDQTVLRVRQFASVMTAFLAGYGLIVIAQGIAMGNPVIQQVLSVIGYVLIIPVACILLTAPAYFRGTLCAFLAWVSILAGIVGILLSVIRT